MLCITIAKAHSKIEMCLRLKIQFFCKNHPICIMTRCAETGRVPPASGVIVNAAELPAEFRTVKIEFITVVVIIAMPTICDMLCRNDVALKTSSA